MSLSDMVLIQLHSNFSLGVCVSILVLSVVDGNVIHEKNTHFYGQHGKTSEVFRTKRALPNETTPEANDVLLKYVCEHNKQRVECVENSVIHLLKASYGRTSLTTCDQNHDKKWSVKCFNNNKTEAIVRNKCDGKRRCDVTASNSVFGDPCPGTIKYLEVRYLCAPENKPISTHVCEHSNLHMECDRGKVIHLLEANYGRTTFAKCTSYNLNWNLNCASDKSEEILREKCDRKRACDVAAYNSIFGDPCPGTIKYIEMQYYCAPADAPPPIHACEHGKLHVECYKGSVIQLVKANYGRTSLAKCDEDHNQRNIKCVNNKTEQIVREICDGKRSCDLTATNSVFGDPCYGTIKYLEMQYLCVPGEAATANINTESTTSERTSYPTADAPPPIHVCEHGKLHVECYKGSVIQLFQANYGRPSLAKCDKDHNQWNVKCVNNKTEEIVRELCDGKRSCDLTATNSVFGDPCYGTIKYLEMQYLCVPGEAATTNINIESTTSERTSYETDAPPPIHACEHGKLHVECYKGSVIQLLQANYGRTSLAKCDEDHNQRNVQCINNKTEEIVRVLCDGKLSCDLTATNSVFGDPCYGTIKYLEMQYLCVPANEMLSIYACEDKNLYLECEEGNGIRTLQANYGRTSLVKCDEKRSEPWSVNCVNNKTEEMVRTVCDGKRSCEVAASNSVFGDPCFGTIKYLEVQYSCSPNEVSIPRTISNTERITTERTTVITKETNSKYACEDNSLHLECVEGNGIRTLQANYGRTSLVKCDEKRAEPWSVNCVNNKTEEIVRNLCHGKRSCNVAATNSVFGDPCFGTIKYLEMQYMCIPDGVSTTISNSEWDTPEGSTPQHETTSIHVCEDNNLHVACGKDKVIHVFEANYGRTSLAKCNQKYYKQWSVDCLTYSTKQIVRRKCDGKRSCDIAASNSVFGDPCVGTIKYLEVQYLCAPVTAISEETEIPYSTNTIDRATTKSFKSVSPTTQNIPTIVNEISKTESDIPRTVSTISRTVSDYPRTVATIPRTVSDYPRTVSENPRTLSDYPRTVSENPRTLSDYPSIVSENPRTLADYPTTDSDIMRIFSEIPKTLYDIATETIKYATSIISDETNAPTVKSSTPHTTECSSYDLQCFKFECPNDFGSYLHPTSRNMFIVCIYWKPTIKTCGKGQVLSEKFMKCVSENHWWSRWDGTRGQQPQFRK